MKKHVITGRHKVHQPPTQKEQLEKEVESLKNQLKKTRIDYFNQGAKEAERVILYGIFEHILDSDFLKELEQKGVITQAYGFKTSVECGISLAVDGILRKEND